MQVMQVVGIRTFVELPKKLIQPCRGPMHVTKTGRGPAPRLLLPEAPLDKLGEFPEINQPVPVLVEGSDQISALVLGQICKA